MQIKKSLRAAFLAAVMVLTAPAMADLDSVRRSAELNSENADAQFNLGVMAMRAKKYKESEKAMKKTVVLSPKDAVAREIYAKVLGKLKRHADAAEQYEAALKLKPQKKLREKIWKGLAMARHRQGDTEGALRAFEQAAKLNPKDARIQENIAKLRSKAGDPRSAIKAFRKALKKDPRNTRAASGVCQIYTQLGEFKKAIKSCGSCLELELTKKQRASASYNLGYAYFRLEDKAKAKKYFSQAVKLDKGLATAHYNMGFLEYEEGQLERALGYFRAALKAKKGSYVEARYNVAVVLGDLSRWDEAAKEYRQLLKQDKKNEDAKINLNYVLERGTGELLEKGSDAFIKGQFGRAKKSWQAALRLDPKNKRAKKFLAKLPKKKAAPKPKPKKAAVKKLVDKDKKILDKGLAMLRKGELAGAMMQLKFYVKNHSKNVKAKKALARARAQLRQKVDGHLKAAKQFVKTNQIKQARASLNQALNLDPENARANALIRELTGKTSVQKASKEEIKTMYFDGVNAYLDGKLDKAIRLWGKVLKAEPGHLDAQRSIDRAKMEMAALKSRKK